ncbi:hypothetical protein [Abyssisolibacter fermentans]|uniref:hypothetical protein n=1 Tax=Abyssisolibacter fermentans TaxID=1766203 RepID=UPI00083418BD|nr:hypothetical protein [Abyssisolibacter fermentans]
MRIIYGSFFTWVSIISIVVYVILKVTNKKNIKAIIGVCLSIYGLFCSITLPSYFFLRVSNSRFADMEFLKWVSEKFNFYVNILSIVSILVIVISIVIIFNARTKEKSSDLAVLLTLLTQITLVIVAFILGLNTINKKFDVASYILAMGYYNSLMLFGIYILRRKICNID